MKMNPLARIFSCLAPAPPPDLDTQAGLQRISHFVGKAITITPGFDKRLAAPVAHARSYCVGIVDALPPPIDIDRQSFSTNPLVHALFASAADIDDMLIASAPVRSFLTAPESWQHDCFFALMAARRTDKKVLGVALQGDIVTTDVSQTLLQFSNQMVMLPSADPDTARANLLSATFDSLLHTFAEHVEKAQATYASLQVERELERARARGQVRQDATAVGFPSRRIAALNERLQRQFDSLQPDVLVNELIRFLMQPEEALSLNPMQLQVTRSGVIQTDGANTGAEPISFMEFHSRDRRSHVVLPVRIRCDEARAALERAKEARVVNENTLLI
jgi:hypothetical protein